MALGDNVEEPDDPLEQTLGDLWTGQFEKGFVLDEFARQFPAGHAAAEERVVSTKIRSVPGEEIEHLFVLRPGHFVAELEVKRRKQIRHVDFHEQSHMQQGVHSGGRGWLIENDSRDIRGRPEAWRPDLEIIEYPFRHLVNGVTRL